MKIYVPGLTKIVRLIFQNLEVEVKELIKEATDYNHSSQSIAVTVRAHSLNAKLNPFLSQKTAIRWDS